MLNDPKLLFSDILYACNSPFNIPYPCIFFTNYPMMSGSFVSETRDVFNYYIMSASSRSNPLDPLSKLADKILNKLFFSKNFLSKSEMHAPNLLVFEVSQHENILDEYSHMNMIFFRYQLDNFGRFLGC